MRLRFFGVNAIRKVADGKIDLGSGEMNYRFYEFTAVDIPLFNLYTGCKRYKRK